MKKIYLLPKSLFLRRILALALIVLFGSSNIYAATITSAQSGDASWNSTWVGGVFPQPGDNVIIAPGHTVTSAYYVFDLSGSFTCNGTLQLSSFAFGVGQLQGNGIITAVAGTVTLTVGSNNASTTFSGVLGSGLLNLNKIGTGVLTLSGNNTYTGLTAVSAGTLRLSNINALGATAGATSVTSGAVLDLNGINYSNAEVLTLNGTGIATGGALINSSATAATYAGDIALGIAPRITANNLITLSGIISGATNLTTAGTSTLILTRLNTYTGTTTVSAGILRATNNTIVASTNGAFGNNASGLLLNGGTIQSNVATFSRPVTVTATNSGIDAYGSARTITSSITNATVGSSFNCNVGGTYVVNAAGQNLILSGVVSNSAGTLSLTKIGTSLLTLSAANTFSGGTIVSAGQLNINHATAPGSGAFTISGGIIDNTTGGSITLSNNNTQNWNGDFTFTGTQSLNMGTGVVTMNASRIITVSANTLPVRGTINHSSLNLTKAGSGTLSFSSQAVTLNNLTISSGILTSTSGSLNLAGNFSNSATFTHNSGTVNLNGTSAQTIGGTSSTSFNNLTISNTASTITSAVISAVNNISLVSGASFTVNGGTLQIAGTISNAGTFNVSNGTIEMNGSSNQIIPANAFANNTIKNLLINNDVSLQGQVILTGTLTMAGIGKTLATNDFLTLKSTASGTASVAPITVNGGGNARSFITGKVIVERYIPGHRGWRFLTAPVITSQSINDAWQEGATNTTLPYPAGNNNPNPGYGMHITGISGGIVKGYDLGPQNSFSLKIYDRSATSTVTSGYKGIEQVYAGKGTNNTLLNFLQGYMVFVRGDRNTNLNLGAAAPLSNTTLRAQGILKTGKTVVPTLNGFNVIGNPFAATIDMRRIAKSGGVTNFFYLYDTRLGSLGDFQTLLWDGTNYIALPGGGSYAAPYATAGSSNFIQSGQAFLVESTDLGSVIIEEVAKEATTSSMIFSPVTQPLQLRTNLYVVNTSANLLDAAVIQYSSDGNSAVDGKDANKIQSISGGTYLGLLRDGKNLVVERRQSITANDTIFYNLMTASKRNYRFEFIADNLDANAGIGFLEDAYLGTSIPVSLSDTTTVDFTVNADAASSAADRFRIVFKVKPVIKGKMKVQLKTNKSAIVVYPNPVVDGRVNVKFINQSKGNYVLKLYNKLGRVVDTKEIYLSESNATETMKAGRSMIKGAYQLEVFSLGNNVASIKVLVL